MKIQLVSQNLRFRHGVYEVIEVRKKFEEVTRTKGKDIDAEREYRGEITIVIS